MFLFGIWGDKGIRGRRDRGNRGGEEQLYNTFLKRKTFDNFKCFLNSFFSFSNFACFKMIFMK